MIRSFRREKRLSSICYLKIKKSKVFLKMIRQLEIKARIRIKKINEV